MVELQTVDSGEGKGTIGALLVDGVVCCWSLELPWLNNTRDISCVPGGEYDLKLEWSDNKKMFVYELKGVIGREDIQIHIANYLEEIEGCIATGALVRMGQNKKYSVGSSSAAFDKFMVMMKGRKDDRILISNRPSL